IQYNAPDLFFPARFCGLFFKCLTIQTVDSCLFCGEFVKRNWHGESPCAEGQSATGVLSPTLILSVRVQVLILNSPGGTRHHVHDDTDTRL
ncbi:TPA: hypothetical protein ACM27A_005211, partial [Escherichia coli]